MKTTVVFSLILSLLYADVLVAQDTIYTNASTLRNVKIRDNQRTFVEYRVPDDYNKKNYFVQKKNIIAICSPRGFHEVIMRDTGELFHSIYFFVNGNGDTVRQDPNYEPSGISVLDSSVKLCRFKNDRDYKQIYGNHPHFYLNDLEKKFLNCTEITFEGVDFSCMKLVSWREIYKGPLIKERYLPNLAGEVNKSSYTPVSLWKKKVLNDMQFSQNSYSALNSVSWVTDQDHTFDARKIPAFIRKCRFQKTEGVGLIFIIEKLSKDDHVITGYWVAFDFANRRTLMIDYIYCTSVGSSTDTFGWDGFWCANLIAAGIYDPSTFRKYLGIMKKGDVELNCD